MTKVRTYGRPPFSVVLLHGGPGAPGQMAPVARELSDRWGILEPLQTGLSIEEQKYELLSIVQEYAALPITLIGFSWGAMLGYLFTASHTKIVKKLILIGSGVYEDRYAKKILEVRLNRLDAGERVEAMRIIEALSQEHPENMDKRLERFGQLMTKSDAFDPLSINRETLSANFEVFQKVWKEAEDLRNTGKFLALGKNISCPVVAFHGDYDPHPAEGVKLPLSRVVKDFRFIPLENCGHMPWIERQARDKFYVLLKQEL